MTKYDRTIPSFHRKKNTWPIPKQVDAGQLTDEFIAGITCWVCGKFDPSQFIYHSNGTKARVCKACYHIIHELFEIPFDKIIETALRHKTIEKIDLYFRVMNPQRA